MRKVCSAAMIGVVILMFLSSTSMAAVRPPTPQKVMDDITFSSELRMDIQKEIGAFYQRNEGNKITIDVMDGFMLHLNQIFEKNAILPPKEVKDPKPKPME